MLTRKILSFSMLDRMDSLIWLVLYVKKDSLLLLACQERFFRFAALSRKNLSVSLFASKYSFLLLVCLGRFPPAVGLSGKNRFSRKNSSGNLVFQEWCHSVAGVSEKIFFM